MKITHFFFSLSLSLAFFSFDAREIKSHSSGLEFKLKSRATMPLTSLSDDAIFIRFLSVSP